MRLSIAGRWQFRTAGLLSLGLVSSLAAQGQMPAPNASPPVPVQIFDFSKTPDIDLPVPPRSILNEAPMGQLPPVPVEASNLPQPASAPTTIADLEAQPQTGAFTIFRNREMRPSGRTQLHPGEPTAVQNRDCAFGTGNTYGSLSIDSGMTWTLVNPYTKFPASDGGVCCDQRTLYIPSIDCTVWLIQYRYSSSTGRGGFRLAVAKGRDNLKNGIWASSYRNTGNFSLLPANTWFDFPDMAYSSGRLYITFNVFNASSQYVNSIVMRQDLATVATGGGGVFYYYLRSGGSGPLGGGASYRFTQCGLNPQSVMLFACHNSTASARLFRWADGTSAGSARDSDINRSIPSWVSSTSNGPRPSGNNWLGFDDHRIASGYLSGSEAGWLWTSNVNGSGRPAPYVRVLRVNASTRAVIANDDVYSSSSTQAWSYPAVGTNSSGHKGVVMSYGSTTRHVTTVGMLVDNYKPSWFGQSLFFLGTGTAGAPSSRWGDYHQVTRHPTNSATFIGTAMRQLNNSSSTSNTQHQYIWFGRDDYTPTWVPLNINSVGASSVPFTIDVTDRNGLKNGTTNAVRSLTPRQGYAITVNKVQGSNLWNSFSGIYASGTTSTTSSTATLTVPDILTAVDTVNINFVPRAILTVQSQVPTSVPITVSVADYFNNQNGNTNFTRTYKNGQALVLTAPSTASRRTFRRWYLDKVAQPSGLRTLNVTMSTNRTALAEYGFFTAGTVTSLGTSCGGPAVGHTAGNSTPEIGETQIYNFTGGTPNLALGAWCIIGWSNTNWSGIPLPLKLDFLQMTGCTAYIDHWLVLPRPTNALGDATVSLGIINDSAFIGISFYSQYMARKAVNPAGLIATNYLRHTIGGWDVR